MYVQFIWICLNMMCPFSVPNLSLQRGKTHHFETSSFVDIIFAVKATAVIHSHVEFTCDVNISK